MCVGVTVEELCSESSFAGFLYAPPQLLNSGRFYPFLSKLTVCSNFSLPKTACPLLPSKAQTTKIEQEMLQGQFLPHSTLPSPSSLHHVKVTLG